jgi:hypothetical protein
MKLWMGTIIIIFGLGYVGACTIHPSDRPSYTDLVILTNAQAAEIRRLQTEVESYREDCK